MSYMLPHLHNGWQVDQAILSEEDRVVVIRFGHDWDPTCMKMDEVLYSIAEKVTPGGSLPYSQWPLAHREKNGVQVQ
jgi:thiol-disulfide isomerase/thioredoxin